MEHRQMATDALNTKSDLKIIMKGEVVEQDYQKIGVTSTIFVSKDKEKVETFYNELCQNEPDAFFMIYAVNLDEKLSDNDHYPSIAISSLDLT